ncbi:MAG: hypothetical protein Tsb0017_05900 [Geothermobacteraceae bacterium]
MLSLANRERVTPLWALQLKRHGLLDRAPKDLQDYLLELLQANRERNRAMLAAMDEMAQRLTTAGSTVIALKGGAALTDDLYGDIGARILGDIDLLIDPDLLPETPGLLKQLGYLWDPEQERIWRSLPQAASRHFPRAHLPGTPVAVELHYRLLSRQGDLWNTDELFAAAIPSPLPHIRLLCPETRLAHNVIHALTSELAWARSHLELRDLAEFAWLWRRDRPTAATGQMLRGRSLALPAHCYARLAADLFRLDLPDAMTRGTRTRHLARFLARLEGQLHPLRARLNLALRYLPWLWRNHRLAVDGINNRQRLGYLAHRLAQGATWRQVREHWR